MKLCDYKFGFADATKELMIEPSIFESAFYDPNNILNKLTNSWKYMIIGRKGVGKSAYSSKMQSIANTTGRYITSPILLNDFEYSTFAKTKSDSNIVGTKKYLDSWNFIILLSIFKILYNQLQITEVTEFNDMIALLERLSFPINDSFKNNVKNVSRLKLGASIGIFDAEYETEFGHKPLSFSERINTLVEKMEIVLSTIFLGKKLFILIDGVDDVLRYKKNQLEILSSLLRSVDMLNEFFYSNQKNIKLILFIREDIINQVTDPDLNKIKRDGSIHLSWTENTDYLKEIAELRFKLTLSKSSKNIWYNIFPQDIHEQDSWHFLLEHTLYKPRDVLQFLCTCQDLYPNKESLTHAEMRAAIKSYSREYFMEEMKNELSGFSSDQLINILPSIFQKIGSTSFYLNNFLQITNDQSTSKEYSEQDIRLILLQLFESGYIGQLVKGSNHKESVVFKYRNPSASIDYSQKFLIHRGIQRGLGVFL